MMLRRLLALLPSFAVMLSVPASGVAISPFADATLETAAARMKARDYAGAREAAQKATSKGAGDFLAGMASAKAGDWETAASFLARAADSFPLLADYALANQAKALYRLGRFAEAQAPLEKLRKGYPDSPVVRSASLLLADTLCDRGDFPAAIRAYQQFIEKYPAGTDSLTALYKLALCRDLAGETTAAVASLRQIWLNNPASPLAAKAETELQTLAARGAKVPPYTPEELFHRAGTLYNLKKYSQALSAFKQVPTEGQSEEFRERLALRTGQALFRARQYREAEQTFVKLQSTATRKGIGEESAYWLARCQDRNGKEDTAVTTYLTVVETAPSSELADDTLLEAALIRKQQKKGTEAVALLKKLVRDYPRSNLKTGAMWEIAWLSYQAGDLATAADYFRKLTESDATRERALYWLGHTLNAATDVAGAKKAFGDLLAAYPIGYYAFSYRQEAQVADGQNLPSHPPPVQLLPLPEGFERVKALIAFGLFEEAGKELALHRKKARGEKTIQALARLYIEMDDYNSPLSLVTRERPVRSDKDPVYAWGISYPLAYREAVQREAAAKGVAENLIYAIIRAESSFSPTALSPVGAVGLMQLMPSTAAIILDGKGGKGGTDRLTRPEVNIKAGVRHLKDLLALYGGDPVAAIAAYNAGAGNVNKWRKKFGPLPPAQFIESIPFGETREYVKRVLATAHIYNRLYHVGSPISLTRTAAPPALSSTLPTMESRLVN